MLYSDLGAASPPKSTPPTLDATSPDRKLVVLKPLTSVLNTISPRFSPPATPLASILIHSSVLLLWAILFLAAFVLHGVFAWGTGLAYAFYDTVLLLFTTWQSLRLLRPAAPLREGGPRRRLGVIIAAYNEALVLPVTLQALFDQIDPPDQIVIADDGSTDATAAVLAARYGLVAAEPGVISAASPNQPSLRWLRVPHGGKAKALNAAMALMDTEIVLTVDADTLLDRGAIGAMRREFSARPGLVAATGVLRPICSDGISGRFFQWFQTYEYLRNFLSRYAWAQLDSLLLISGAFAGFRREAVLEVGGFDPDCLVEDYELIHRLRRFGAMEQRGWQTGVIGAAQGRTAAPSTVSAFLRQRRRWFGGFLQTQYWYRDMVGNARYGWLGLAMLPIKAIDTLQPIYGLTAFFLLLSYLVSGQAAMLIPVGGVISAKIGIDLVFHLWSVAIYRRWIGDKTNAHPFHALLAALAEPFTFQILRHTGAAWGWIVFLTGRGSWGVQHRFGLVPPVDEF